MSASHYKYTDADGATLVFTVLDDGSLTIRTYTSGDMGPIVTLPRSEILPVIHELTVRP